MNEHLQLVMELRHSNVIVSHWMGLVDWIALFTQYPYLIEGISFWIIWMQYGIALGFIISYPLMFPFQYMFLRIENFRYDDGRYFRDVYPTYRSYMFRLAPFWYWKYVTHPLWYLGSKMPTIRFHQRHLRWKYISMPLWYLDNFSGKVIRYYLT